MTFTTYTKPGYRLHLGCETINILSPSHLICGHRIDPTTWQLGQTTLVEFVSREDHCVNCEMMLRSLIWIKRAADLLAAVDRGDLEL